MSKYYCLIDFTIFDTFSSSILLSIVYLKDSNFSSTCSSKWSIEVFSSDEIWEISSFIYSNSEFHSEAKSKDQETKSMSAFLSISF